MTVCACCEAQGALLRLCEAQGALLRLPRPHAACCRWPCRWTSSGRETLLALPVWCSELQTESGEWRTCERANVYEWSKEGCQGLQRSGVSDAEVVDLSETRYGMLRVRDLLQEQEPWLCRQRLKTKYYFWCSSRTSIFFSSLTAPRHNDLVAEVSHLLYSFQSPINTMAILETSTAKYGQAQLIPGSLCIGQ